MVIVLRTSRGIVCCREFFLEMNLVNMFECFGEICFMNDVAETGMK